MRNLARRVLRYDVVLVSFVTVLLLSNITATKLIAIPVGSATLIVDGGAVLFPLSYILGDILAEVYGFARASRAIIMGFVVSVLAALVFLIVQIAPPAPEYAHQEAFAEVLGFVPRIVAASLVGYLAGQFLNAYVLTALKRRWPSHLFTRLLGSTIVGEGVDTVCFCLIAFGGVISAGAMVNYVVVGFLYKVGIEALLLPVTARVIAAFHRHGDAPRRDAVLDGVVEV
ncbi:MAG: queuosine precursor transporter [Bowdeniella nasicola]|nr:queuosine precursor transporter [Bowdeniella nasicola]